MVATRAPAGLRVLVVALATGLACSSLSPLEPDGRVVMWFDEHDEVFTGSVARTGPMLGRGFVDVVNHHGDLRCVGRTELRVVPPEARPPHRCDGMAGRVLLSCSDGRELLLDYTVEEGCARGYGEGRDSLGNGVRAVFGQSALRAEIAAREARARLAGADRLPPRPSAVAAAAGGASTGTAFFVSWEGHLVTNHHVVKDRRRVRVLLEEGDGVPARILATDPEDDLALLQVDVIARPLPLRASRPLVKGEEVFALGYPLVAIQGQEQKATFGRVNALSGAKGDARFAQVDVPIQPGNSGGPLIDRHGEVVGVVTAMLDSQKVLEVAGVVPQNVNYALKADRVMAALREQLEEEWTPAPALAAESDFSQLVDRSQHSVVLVVAW